MDKIEAILDRIPKFYVRDKASKIYGVLKAFASEFDIAEAEYINRADNAIGIMDTDPRDLDWRWGEFLGVHRLINETDESYRMRLVNTINSLHGGTADAIRYAVALILGIADDDVRMKRQILIYDAWKYPNSPEGMKAYGNFMIVVKFDGDSDFDDIYYNGIESDIANVVSVVKAAGTNCAVVFGCTSNEFVGQFHHHQLIPFTQDDIRWRLVNKIVTHDNDVTGLYDANAREILASSGIKLLFKDKIIPHLYGSGMVLLHDVNGIPFMCEEKMLPIMPDEPIVPTKPDIIIMYEGFAYGNTFGDIFNVALPIGHNPNNLYIAGNDMLGFMLFDVVCKKNVDVRIYNNNTFDGCSDTQRELFAYTTDGNTATIQDMYAKTIKSFEIYYDGYCYISGIRISDTITLHSGHNRFAIFINNGLIGDVGDMSILLGITTDTTSNPDDHGPEFNYNTIPAKDDIIFSYDAYGVYPPDDQS